MAAHGFQSRSLSAAFISPQIFNTVEIFLGGSPPMSIEENLTS